MTEQAEVFERLELSRGESRRRLREALSQLGEPIQILAEEVHGEADAVIDWIATLRSGRAVVGLLGADPSAGSLLEEGLVQRAWVARRLRDWQKLAPGLAVRPELRPILLLLARAFSRRLRIAAREADAETLWLATYRYQRHGSEIHPVLQPVSMPPSPRPGAGLASEGEPLARPPLRSVFRTGLSDEDLSPSPA